MPQKKRKNQFKEFVVVCLGGSLGIIFSAPFSFLVASKVIARYSECNPPDSDCNGIVAFTRAISYGGLIFFLLGLSGGVVGVILCYCIFLKE